jgi:hypothetical protein
MEGLEKDSAILRIGLSNSHDFPSYVVPRNHRSEPDRKVKDLSPDYFIPGVRDWTGQASLFNEGIPQYGIAYFAPN